MQKFVADILIFFIYFYLFFRENISCESSADDSHEMSRLYSLRKIKVKLFSAAVVIGALRVETSKVTMETFLFIRPPTEKGYSLAYCKQIRIREYPKFRAIHLFNLTC